MTMSRQEGDATIEESGEAAAEAGGEKMDTSS